MRICWPTCVVIFALVATGTSAQQIAGGNLAKLRQTPGYQKTILGAAFKAVSWISSGCSSQGASIGRELSVHVVPVLVNAQLQPQSGAWIEHVSVEKCDHPRRLNVLFQVVTPGVNVTVTLLPGTTRADLILQKDATPLVLAAAGIDPGGCKPIYVADTAYARPAGPSSIPGKTAWSELWTVAQCQSRTDVEVTFTPDRTGTRITAHKAAQPI